MPVPRLHEFFALELPPISVWATIAVVEALTLGLLLATGRSGLIKLGHTMVYSSLLIAPLSVALASTVLAAAPCVEGSGTVSGIVRGVGTIQEEPTAAPQSSFILEKPSCGERSILVAAPAPLFCSNGDTAVVEGRYLPPSRLIDVPIIDGTKVECRASDSTTPAAR